MLNKCLTLKNSGFCGKELRYLHVFYGGQSNKIYEVLICEKFQSCSGADDDDDDDEGGDEEGPGSSFQVSFGFTENC